MQKLKPEKVKKLVKYWYDTAKHDFKTMNFLFEGKRYSDSLFFGHIILEKILKALVVQEKKEHAPLIHDLIQLQENAKIKLSKEEVIFLNRVNDFNLRARYPEYKLDFYKKCDKNFTEENIKKIKQLYKKLCQKIKPKK